MNHKKWAAAAIAAVVGLGMLGTALPASAGSSQPTIKISGKSIAGHTFNAILIASYADVRDNYTTGESATHVTGFELETTSKGSFKKDLIDWIVEINNSTSGNPELEEEDFDGDTIRHLDPLVWVARNWTSDDPDRWHNPNAGNPDVRALADWLRTYFTNNADGWNVKSVEPDSTEDTLLEVDTQGLYFVWDETTWAAAEAGDGTNSLPIIVGTKFYVDTDRNGAFEWLDLKDQTLGMIQVKGEVVNIDKDIVEACPDQSDSCGTVMSEGNETEDVYTAATGEELEFVIQTNVPYYAADTFDNRTFKISDTWTTGLTAPVVKAPFEVLDVNNTLQVTFGADNRVLKGTTDADDPGDAEFIYDQSGTTFTIKLTQNGIDLAMGNPLRVTYKAVVNAGAFLVEGTHTHDTNKAFVTFTNDWVSTDGTVGPTEARTDTDTVYIYTYPFEIVKRDIITQDLLEGAEFSVYGPFAGTDGTVANDIEVMSVSGGTEYLHTLRGLQGNAFYRVTETKIPDDYTAANAEKTGFVFWIEVQNLTEGGVAPQAVYHFAKFSGDLSELTPDSWVTKTTPLDAAWVNPARIDDDLVAVDAQADDSSEDGDVDIFNAELNSDMPSTGGQILLIAGIAGVLGLGAVTFGVVGARKRKATPAAA